MTKLIITEQQYKALLLNEQQTRINENSNDVILGVAYILGVNLTGRNKEIGMKAAENANTLDKIKSTLEDENKTKDLLKSLSEKGMSNPESIIAKNLESLVHKYGFGHKVYNNLQSLL